MEVPVAAYHLRFGIVMAGVFTVSACGSQKAEVDLPQCGPRERALPTAVRAEGLAGEYDLLLVARSGEAMGARAAGELVLQPYMTAREAAVPFRLAGTADIALEQVGAVRLGDLMSRDTVAPGVAVLERRVGTVGGEVSEITLRLGSLANQRNNTRFDGAYTALRVTWVDMAGFGGTWASGVAGPESEGYFCAFRKGGGTGPPVQQAEMRAVPPPMMGADAMRGRVYLTGPSPNQVVSLQPDDGRSVRLVGDLEAELGRLSGALVRVEGIVEERGAIRSLVARAYEVLDIDGAKPLVGVLQEDSGRLEIATDPPLTLRDPPQGLAAMVGAKIWIVGPVDGATVRVQSFGIIRDP